MAIAEDASTPAVTQRAFGTSGTATSNSFSPPAGSWVYVIVAWMFGTGASSTLSCKDSSGNVYTAGPVRNNSGNCDIGIFSFFYATAPGAITVTATCTSTAAASVLLAPRVVTGAAISQTAAATATAAAGTVSVTTTVTGSWVYLAASSGTVGTITANGATTTISGFSDATAGDNGIAGRAASATGTPGATTLGWTAGAASIAALEVLPSTTNGSLSLAPLALSGTVSVPGTSSGSLSLAPLALAGTAAGGDTAASGSLSLSYLALGGTAIVPTTSTGSLSLAPLALSATCGGGDIAGITPSALILPQIIVEAGLIPDSPAGQASTVLRLDDATFGKLDTATLGTAITWTDISRWVMSFTITRPSTRQQGPLWNYQAGTVSILLDNSDGRFDPDNLAGPYISAGLTQLVPMVPVRVRALFAAVTYPLYSGFADGWLPGAVTYEGGYAEITLAGTDAFKVLAGITLPTLPITGVAADTGARVHDILGRAGWYTSAERRVINTGNSTLQGTTLGADPLSLMQIATDSEIGQLYVNGAGAVVFRNRRALLTDARSNTVQAVFGDLPGTVQSAGTELAYAAVGRADDDTTIANDVQATRVGGTLQEVQDAASVTKYLFPRTYSRSDLILQNDSDALNWAQWVLYVARGGEDRFASLTVDPQADAANLWPQVLGREIGDRIQVWQRPAGVAAPVVKDCFIAGITHVWDSGASTWLTTFSLQDATKYGAFLTLDNPTLGKLDGNALTF